MHVFHSFQSSLLHSAEIWLRSCISNASLEDPRNSRLAFHHHLLTLAHLLFRLLHLYTRCNHAPRAPNVSEKEHADVQHQEDACAPDGVDEQFSSQSREPDSSIIRHHHVHTSASIMQLTDRSSRFYLQNKPRSSSSAFDIRKGSAPPFNVGSPRMPKVSQSNHNPNNMFLTPPPSSRPKFSRLSRTTQSQHAVASGSVGSPPPMPAAMPAPTPPASVLSPHSMFLPTPRHGAMIGPLLSPQNILVKRSTLALDQSPSRAPSHAPPTPPPSTKRVKIDNATFARTHMIDRPARFSIDTLNSLVSLPPPSLLLAAHIFSNDSLTTNILLPLLFLFSDPLTRIQLRSTCRLYHTAYYAHRRTILTPEDLLIDPLQFNTVLVRDWHARWPSNAYRSWSSLRLTPVFNTATKADLSASLKGLRIPIRGRFLEGAGRPSLSIYFYARLPCIAPSEWREHCDIYNNSLQHHDGVKAHSRCTLVASAGVKHNIFGRVDKKVWILDEGRDAYFTVQDLAAICASHYAPWHLSRPLSSAYARDRKITHSDIQPRWSDRDEDEDAIREDGLSMPRGRTLALKWNERFQGYVFDAVSMPGYLYF
jgi:hypothetical protein